MPTLSQMSVFQLSKKLLQVEEEIAKICPDLVAERDVIKRILEAKKLEAEQSFSKVDGPTDAILLCLDLYGDGVMSKKQMKERIINEGYISENPEAAGNIIRDTINRMVRNGQLFYTFKKGDPTPKVTRTKKT
jgi:hypothetical protein